MSLQQFTVRGGEDWLLFAHRNNAPDDDRAYIAITECWPVWLDVERRFGDGQWGSKATSLSNPRVLAMVAAHAEDRDFHIPFTCDECGEPYRFVAAEGIESRCGCRGRHDE